MRSFFRRKPRTQAFFDEPGDEVAGSIATFRGWVASLDPIESIVLEADGRLDTIVARQDRPDVRAALGLPHVAGWQHWLHLASATACPRAFTATLLVNGKAVARKRIACTAPDGERGDDPDGSSHAPYELFCARAAALPASARVLETGTRRANPDIATHSHRLFPAVPRANYVMADVQDGIDVDVIVDAHALPEAWTGQFDAYVSHAVFEHLERPWIAAREVARVLAPGGFCHVWTHQAFPLHGYPSDYFRFSTGALRVMFEDAGLEVLEVGYQHRVKILLPPDLLAPGHHDAWNRDWPAYAYVALVAQKPGPARGG